MVTMQDAIRLARNVYEVIDRMTEVERYDNELGDVMDEAYRFLKNAGEPGFD